MKKVRSFTARKNQFMKANKIINLDTTTRNAVANKDDLNQSIKNAENKTAEMSRTRINDKVRSIENTMAGLNKTFSNLNNSRLVNDKRVYENVANKADTINRNMQQLKEDPPGISIFGGNK